VKVIRKRNFMRMPNTIAVSERRDAHNLCALHASTRLERHHALIAALQQTSTDSRLCRQWHAVQQRYAKSEAKTAQGAAATAQQGIHGAHQCSAVQCSAVFVNNTMQRSASPYRA
jgi:hypothetical protein